MFSWSEFMVGFLGNLSADFIIGVCLYFLFTNLPERKKERENLQIGLSLYFDELVINRKRLATITQKLESIETNEPLTLPPSLAHSAWDMIQEVHLLTKVKNTKLIHHIFQLQEKVQEINNELRKTSELLKRHPAIKRKEDIPYMLLKKNCEEIMVYLDETISLIKMEFRYIIQK